MRIIGGIFRGRVLAEFDRIGVRPTSDKAREALFNIIQFKTSGALFLDLFSGTGAVGIEALSRGARGVVFNDSSRESIKLIKSNLAKLKIAECSTVSEVLKGGAKGNMQERAIDGARELAQDCAIGGAKIGASGAIGGACVSQCDGVLFLKNCSADNLEGDLDKKDKALRFDIIYIDPPYSTDLIERILPYLTGALAKDGIAIVEDEKPFDESAVDLSAINLSLTDRRKYGRAHLTFFKAME